MTRSYKIIAGRQDHIKLSLKGKTTSPANATQTNLHTAHNDRTINTGQFEDVRKGFHFLLYILLRYMMRYNLRFEGFSR